MSWAISWGTALAPGTVTPGTTLPGATMLERGVTIRNVVHTSIGGSSVRVTLSNAFGTAELPVTAATVALPAARGEAAAMAGTVATLTFGGAESAVIPAGAELTSDPVQLEIPADADLLVSIGTWPGPGPATFHLHACQESYIAPGDAHPADVSGAEFTGRTESWFYVADVQVPDAAERSWRSATRSPTARRRRRARTGAGPTTWRGDCSSGPRDSGAEC